eukprot:970524-Amphidinium_carterae.1
MALRDRSQKLQQRTQRELARRDTEAHTMAQEQSKERLRKKEWKKTGIYVAHGLFKWTCSDIVFVSWGSLVWLRGRCESSKRRQM